jgi:glutamyl-tRNA reductase
MSQSIAVVGLDFRTAAIEIREQLALAGCALEEALQHLAMGRAGNAAAAMRARETVILSTCNRLEFYLLAIDEAAARAAVSDYLHEARGIPSERLAGHLYCRTGERAVEHLMRVATGLESMILGEPQILGQVSRAYEQAREAGACGAVLSHLFAAALRCGKRAHCETEIGAHTTSLSHAAADLLAGELLGPSRVLIVGAGEMAGLAAQAVRDHCAGELRFVNRSQAHAETLAERFGGAALAWRDLRAGLAWADAVVSATGAPHVVVLRGDVEAALAERGDRPLLLVDLALPRDIDPAVDALPRVRCYDLDRLNVTLEENRAKRAAAAPAAEGIVREERAAFCRWLRSLDAVPTVVDLRARAEQVASAELERTLRRLDPRDERLARELDCMAHRIINKLLHEPTVRLKSEAESGNGALYRQAVRELFDLSEVCPCERDTSLETVGATEHE